MVRVISRVLIWYVLTRHKGVRWYSWATTQPAAFTSTSNLVGGLLIEPPNSLAGQLYCALCTAIWNHYLYKYPYLGRLDSVEVK